MFLEEGVWLTYRSRAESEAPAQLPRVDLQPALAHHPPPPQQIRGRSPCPASPVQTCSQRLLPFASSFSSCLDSCQEAAVSTFQTPARLRLQVSTTSSPVASTPCKSPSPKPSEPDSGVKRGTTI